MRGHIALQLRAFSETAPSTATGRRCGITAKPFGFAQAPPGEKSAEDSGRYELVLLLVEDRGVLVVLALCGCPVRGDGAAFAVSRNHSSTRARDSSVIPNGQRQCAVVDFFVRPRV